MDTAPQHLLIVDDDRDIRTLLADHLRDAGYRVTTAADGVEMRKVLEKGPVDLITLDLNMPREDGLTLCRDLRARSQTPVIMLTARGEPIDRIIGLEMGADDYLAKPFEPRELLARIRSVLRRAQSLPPNLERRLLDEAGRVTVLSGAEFRLLKVLIDHANRVLSREQLLALGVVRQNDALDRAVDLQVSRLRQKFGEGGGDLIRTVRNEGYVLAAPVTFE